MRIASGCLGIGIVITALLPQPSLGAMDLEAEISRRRAAVRDFQARQKSIGQEERARERHAEKLRRARQREEEAQERARAAFVRNRVAYDPYKIEKREQQYEKELEREETARDRLRRAFVKERDRVERILGNGPKIDESLEYGL